MRRFLGIIPLALALALSLSACGSDDGDTAADPSATETSTAAASPTGTPPDQTGPDQTQPGGSDGAGYEVIGLYSATAAGGTASDQLSPIGTDAELEAYVAQFRGPALGDEIRAAARKAGGGQLMAAVVGLGCDIPPGVEVAPSGDTFTVQAQKVADPLPECLAAVTTVVVISVGT